MKKSYLVLLSFVMLVIFGNMAFSQFIPVSQQIQDQKEQGQIPLPSQVTPAEPVVGIAPSAVGNAPAGLLVPYDASFTLLCCGNDDGSWGPFALPWTFCFYGTNESAFYINNNGNVSFGGSYFNYSSTGFPYAGFPMLAPFWADVDTRSGLGNVYYKVSTSPNRVVVIWDNVGYFSIQGDKRNTFELVFTDGNDPLIGIGKNVAFSYADMQWTTGSASGGSGGFGGIASTVGVNKGDGIKYALVGRFDHAGSDYDGPGGANDGISYLDDKLYIFDACQETIIIPTGVPISDWALVILGVALLAVGTIYILRRS